jgi:glycosyltransferase involved in cell wall biosynthesis
MLLSAGHEVNVYGVDHTDIPGQPNFYFHPVVDLDDIRNQWGDGDNRFEIGYNWKSGEFRHDLNSPTTDCTAKFRRNTTKLISAIKKPDDFLLLSQGYYQKPIADAVGLYLTCEPGIGYRGSYTKFRAFESSYIMNFTYGSEHPRESINGNYYDRIIPNYFDLNDFKFEARPKGDYLLYMGRIIPRKGVETAMKVAEALKMKLLIVGQGNIRDIGYNYTNIEVRPSVGIEERKEIMANALVTLTPSLYLEPFCGVAVESMLSGTPVVSTNFGAFTDTVLDGVSGYKCDTLRDFVENTEKALVLSRGLVFGHAQKYAMYKVNGLFQKWWYDLHRLYQSTVDKSRKAWHFVE